VRGFTDALRMELEIEGAPVSSTTVHPGGIRTNIVRNSRIDESAAGVSGGGTKDDMVSQFDKLARTSPAKAATVILGAVEANRRRVLIGPDARLFEVAARLPAGVYQRILVKGSQRRH
jgi:butyryl-CoA dehydrogenase